MEKFTIVLGTQTDASKKNLEDCGFQIFYNPEIPFIDLCNIALKQQVGDVIGFSDRELYLYPDTKTVLLNTFKMVDPVVGAVYGDSLIRTKYGNIFNLYPSYFVGQNIEPVLFVNGLVRNEIFKEEENWLARGLDRLSFSAPIIHIPKVIVEVVNAGQKTRSTN